MAGLRLRIPHGLTLGLNCNPLCPNSAGHYSNCHLQDLNSLLFENCLSLVFFRSGVYGEGVGGLFRKKCYCY